MIFHCYLILLLSYAQSGTLYYYENRDICRNNGTINKQWLLKIKSNKSFEYSIVESDNKNRHSKSDTLFFDGFWQFYDDTLFLHSHALRTFSGSEVKYLRKNEDLYSLGALIDSIGENRTVTLRYISRKDSLFIQANQ